MPNWDTKVEEKQYNDIYYLADIQVGEEVRKSQNSDYYMIRLMASPKEGTEGISSSGNMLFVPEWLEADFSPEVFALDTIALSQARAKRNKGEALDSEEAELVKLGGQKFHFGRGFYDPRGRSYLQNLLGSDYEEFKESVGGMTPEEFGAALRDAVRAQENPIFIVRAGQQTDQDGDLSDRFELQEIRRIETQSDIERFVKYRSKKADMMFDPEGI